MDRRLTRRDALTLLGGAALAGTATATAAAQPAPSTRRPIGIVSRHLQWTDRDGAIAVAKEAGFDAIEWNVRPGGHVAPGRVEVELPRAVEATRKAGLAATMITTSIQDAQSPFAEPILRAAKAAGIRWYRGGEYFRYDYTRPLLPQLEALKPRIASLVALNQQYGTTWAYHTHSAPGMIGGGVWDIWHAIKDFDARSIGLNFDLGHATARNGAGWIDAATVVAPFIAALAVKDVKWERGPRGWRAEFCPVGEGMIDLTRTAGVLDRAGFSGPINIHYEHSGLLGTDLGTWTLPITRDRFVAIVRKDLEAVRQGLSS